jgi:hypothetical protein
MAKKGPARPAEEAAPAPKKKFPVPISTLICLAVAAPVGWWTFNTYRKWATFRTIEVESDRKLAAQQKRNTELSIVYDAVQLKKFTVCNKTPDVITVNWVGAAFHDGKAVEVFNSDHCQDFKPIVLDPGSDSSVLLRSSQPGCNWDGSVFYYAMRYTQENENEERYRIYNMVGPYQGFDRDCYTFR